MVLSVFDFVGRFHPVVVHLPIGILLLACFFHLLSIKDRYGFLRAAIPLMLLIGAGFAIISSITGYLLSQSGDYDEALTSRHQWMGIITTIVSIAFYFLYRKKINSNIQHFVSILVILLVTITGHLGGSLTHGSGYITDALYGGGASVLQPIPDIQNAEAFKGVVQPILNARCISCHGPQKQKGQLRLDSEAFILKGGEDGKAIVPGNTEESMMIHNILLPKEDKKHMPPKEKPQPALAEIQVLQWWVQHGASFTKKIKDLPQDAKIKQALQNLETGAIVKETIVAGLLPEKEVKKGDANIIEQLKKAGVVVFPFTRNTNYLSVNFVTATGNTDSLLNLLITLKDQVLSLNLDDRLVTNNTLKLVGKMEQLKKLQLTRTQTSDVNIKELLPLENLESLNLNFTEVTAVGLAQLQNLKKLKNLYLNGSKVNSKDWGLLKKTFPNTNIDTGGYRVPTLATDTQIVKP